MFICAENLRPVARGMNLPHGIGRILLLVVLTTVGVACAQTLKPWGAGATPALQLADIAGRKHNLADYRGKVVLVNFWATWCEPCREEMPSMQRLKKRFGDKPFVVMAVNVGEGETRIQEYLDRSAFDFIVLRDHSSVAMKAWKAKGLPASFIVGPDGRVRYSHLGELNWDDEKLIALVAGQFAR